MRIKLINARDYSIVDQFTLNKSLEDSVEYLKSKYMGDVVCEGGIINFYVRLIKGVD